jgi:peptidoglycan biosynthesis protein MviN/MurJ (putative lipid II flippase)
MARDVAFRRPLQRREEAMIAKVSFAFVALALQYLLLHSHKAGPSHWIWIASASCVLLLAGMSPLRRVAGGGKGAGLSLATVILLSLIVSPAIYAVREWVQFPDSVHDALVHDVWFYLAVVTVASGGWLFALLLLWLCYRAVWAGSEETSNEQ